MKRRRYPLEALRDLRRRTLEQRRTETAERQNERVEAERALFFAQSERERAEQAQRELEGAEQTRLEQGGARAADLQRQGAWRASARREIDGLRDGEEAARHLEGRASAVEQAARVRLATSDAEARAVERHERAWRERRATGEELAEEQDAADAHGARARRDGRR